MKPTLHTIRIYSPYPPDSLTEGAFHIILNQAKALKKLGFQVEMMTWKDSKVREKIQDRTIRVLSSWLEDIASPEVFYYPKTQESVFPNLTQMDLGIYHYSFAHHWLRSNHPRPEKRTAVYFHNLESDLFEIRKTTTQNPLHRWIHTRNAKKLYRHELELQKFADELWFASLLDLRVYQKRGSLKNDSQLRLVAPSFEADLFEKRSRFLSEVHPPETYLGIIGHYDFEPNRASLEWIIDHLAPLLQKRNFRGKIKIAGKGIPPELRQKIRSFPFCQVLGFIQDVEDFWKDLSYLLVPQKGGSGIRIKLLEALASGIPVLANQEAIQALDPKLHSSPLLYCSDSPEDWADRILGESSLECRKTLQSKGIEPSLLGSEIYRFLLADQSSNWL
jgi:glycosyltransferase involved in cell wall biosynthesis